MHRLNDEAWKIVTDTFIHLFEMTTAYSLFDNRQYLVDQVRASSPTEQKPNGVHDENHHGKCHISCVILLTLFQNLTVVRIICFPASSAGEKTDILPDDPEKGTSPGAAKPFAASEERHKEFQQIIVKCVLQLLLIQTVHELLNKENVYANFPAVHLMNIMLCLEKSFHFAQRFNSDNELRTALWKLGKLILYSTKLSFMTVIQYLSFFFLKKNFNRVYETTPESAQAGDSKRDLLCISLDENVREC